MTKPALGDLILASRSVVVSLGNNKPTAEPLAVMSNAAEAAGVIVPIPICEKVGLLKTNAIAIRIRIRLMHMWLTISYLIFKFLDSILLKKLQRIKFQTIPRIIRNTLSCGCREKSKLRVYLDFLYFRSLV